MAEISVGAAVGEGFGLIRHRPLAVLGWGVIYVVVLGLLFALMAPAYMAMFAPIIAAAKAGVAPPNPQLMQAQMMRMQGMSYLVDFASLMLGSVFYCAVFRAVVHPERKAFAYLRIGAPEFYLAFLLLCGSVVLGIGLVIAMIPVGVIVAVLAMSHLIPVAVIVGVIGVIGLIGAVIYLALRLSFVGPMMVEDGKFHLGDAWTLTKGKVGGLFLIALVVFAIAIVGEIVLVAVMLAVGVGGLSAVAGGVSAIPVLFQQPPMTILAKVGPILAVTVLLLVPFVGAFLALAGAPWARAYLDVKPATDIAEAFS